MQRFLISPTVDQIPHTADVIVIGGGPAGTAALWAIEKLAPGTKSVLIEKSDRLGAGSSLASLENFRICWPTLCLARQMQRSLDVFEHADEYLGEGAAQTLALKKQGYLFCAFTDRQAQALKNDVQHLHAIGLTKIEYLDADEVRYRFGWVGERVVAAKYDPDAGWLDSNALIYSYAKSAASALFLMGIPNVHIRVENNRVVGVSIPGGRIDAPNIIIAAGAGVRAIGRTAGIELPVVLRPRQSFTTGWRHAQFPEQAPMIIGAAPFPHVRPEARSGAIFGWEYTWNYKQIPQKYRSNAHDDALIVPLDSLSPLKDSRFPSITLALLARQFGHQSGEGFADTRYLRGISHNIGYYVYRDASTAYQLQDDGQIQPYDSERAIIDHWPSIDGLFVSIAHVGHGIMSSPAAGEILAHRLLGLPLPDPSFEAFSLDTHWVEYDEGVL